MAGSLVGSLDMHSKDLRAIGETEQRIYSLDAWREWYRGPAASRRFIVDGPLAYRWRFLPARANGQLAVMGHTRDTSGTFVPNHLAVLTLRGSLIDEINGHGAPRAEYLFRPELVVRGSTGPARPR